MSTLGKITLFFVFLVQIVYSANVEAKVSSKEVIKGNVVQLEIKAIGENVEFPKINSLANASVVRSSTQSSLHTAWVNGDFKSEKSTSMYIRFLPKKDLTIPSYIVKIDGKDYQTKPIDIKVLTSKAPQLKADALYSFELKSEKTEVMEGESFIVNLYISISDHLKGAQLSDLIDPQMQGFFSKVLREVRKYRRNGYTIIEKKYLLTAKSDGNITIGSAKAKLGEVDLRRRDFFGRYVTQWHDITSNDLYIQVNPVPQKSDFTGKFTAQSRVDATEVKANKPVNLTITIKGKGNLEYFEFPSYEIDGVSVFSDEPKVQNHISAGELFSTYTINFAMISDRDFTIPALDLTSYNPELKKIEKLQIASYDIKVKGDKNALVAVPPVSSSKQIPASPPVQQSIQTKMVHSVAWWMLAVAFAVGMFMMYLLIMLLPKLKRSNKGHQNDEALQILYPHINESSEVEEMVRKLYARKSGDRSVEIDKKALRVLIEKFRK